MTVFSKLFAPVYAPCSDYVHPWSDSCYTASAGLLLHALQASFRLYVTVYVVSSTFKLFVLRSHYLLFNRICIVWLSWRCWWKVINRLLEIYFVHFMVYFNLQLFWVVMLLDSLCWHAHLGMLIVLWSHLKLLVFLFLLKICTF